MGQHCLGITKPKQASDVAMEFFLQKFTEFCTDWLSNWLMPSNKCILITAWLQAWFFHCSMSLMPFCIAQYIQCILQGLTSVLICVPFILADVKGINLVIHVMGFLCVTEIIRNFYSVYFDYKVLFVKFLIRVIGTAVQWVEPSWQQNVMDISLFRW